MGTTNNAKSGVVMNRNAQDVNTTQRASTSDGVARSNAMTRHEFLKRILQSGEITRVAQHLALAIVILADECRLEASVRDLERMTGWSKSKIADHLGELDAFITVTLGVGRGKSIFEVQGMIEDALNRAIVNGSRAPVASAGRTQRKNSVRRADSIADATADTKRSVRNSVRILDATADMSAGRTLQREPENGRGITTRATKESPSEIVISPPSPNGEGEWAPAPAALPRNNPHMNSVGFVISEAHNLFIPAAVVKSWQERFKYLPDLDAAMKRLSCNLLSRGTMHPGWSCPEGWMVGVLADMNREAEDKKRITEAKISSTQRNQPAKTYRR